MARKSRKHALKTNHKSSALNFIYNRGVQIVVVFNDPPPTIGNNLSLYKYCSFNNKNFPDTMMKTVTSAMILKTDLFTLLYSSLDIANLMGTEDKLNLFNLTGEQKECFVKDAASGSDLFC
jgi:hypothetical protein